MDNNKNRNRNRYQNDDQNYHQPHEYNGKHYNKPQSAQSYDYNYRHSKKYDVCKNMMDYVKVIKGNQSKDNTGDNEQLQHKHDYKQHQRQQRNRNDHRGLDTTFFVKPKRYQDNYPESRFDKERLDSQLEEYRRKQGNKPSQRQQYRQSRHEQVQNFDFSHQRDNNKQRNHYPHGQRRRDEYNVDNQYDSRNRKRNIPQEMAKPMNESLSWNNQSFKKEKKGNNKQQVNKMSQLNIAFDNSLIERNRQQKDDSGLWIQPQNILNQLSLSSQKPFQISSQIAIINSHNSQSLSYLSSIDDKKSFRLEQQDNSIQEQRLFIQKRLQIKQCEMKDEYDEVYIQKILDKIRQSESYEQKDILLQFINIENIVQFRIKEIQLLYLDLSLNLTLQNGNIIVKDCLIDIESLVNYISFYKIHHVFPNMGFKQQQHIEFSFCKVRMPAIKASNQEKQVNFIKKGKKEEAVNKPEIKIKKMKLRCMNCLKFSTVPVIQQDNSSKLSCRQCNQKMQGRFSKMQIC